ncbi:MAG: hypothetical protein HYS40_03405 [Gemmatimonadetes bacterium]|nr:hypothetical protein [Gemmatimonadota bacterium]
MSDVQYRRKVIPYAISLLWRAGDGGAAGPAPETYPLFLQQRALNALYDHYRLTPDQGILGFLLGNLYECPESGIRYTVIDLVMRLSAQIYADKTTLVISRVWDKMQEELAKSGGSLLGWYHSHPPAGIELPRGDVETHLQYFAEPWQVALVLGTDDSGPLAGFFRPAPDAVQAPAVLPFYEILDPRAVTQEGKKKSSVRWKNYKPHKPPVLKKPQSAGAASAAAPPAPETEVITPQATATIPRMQPAPKVEPPPVALPAVEPAPVRTTPAPQPSRVAADERAVAPAAPVRRPLRPLQPKRFSLAEAARGPAAKKKKGRGALFGALTVVLLAGASAGYWFGVKPRLAARAQLPEPPAAAAPESTMAAALESAPVARDTAGDAAPATTPQAQPEVSRPSSTAPPETPPVTARLDQLSDTLGRLVRNYQDRARLFDTRQMDCAGLSRGLVAVESIWIAYNTERKALPVPLDAQRAARDQTLYSAVDSVESHFDRSQCDRP